MSNSSKVDLEKVTLNWVIKLSIPVVKKDGTLGFRLKTVFEADYFDVLLPKEVTQSENEVALTKYLEERFGESLVSEHEHLDINIWEGAKNEFRWDRHWDCH